MKKIFLIGICLVSFSSIAQFNITLNGVIVNNDEIISLSSYGYPQSNKSFHINNTTTGNIKTRIKVTGIVNTDGTNLQVCTNGSCYNGASVNSLFPPNTPMTIASGTNGLLEIANFDAGNGTQIIDYVFRVYQQDLDGNEIGTPINFTYRYNPNLSNATYDSLEKMGVQIESTLIEQEMNIEATQSSVMSIYDNNGRLILNSDINVGGNIIQLQNVSSGVYLANFTDEEGNIASIKIIVK